MIQGLLIGVFCALVFPATSLALGIDPVWLPGASAAWRVSHVSAASADSGVIAGVLATQAALLFAAPLIWRWLGPLAPKPVWLDRRIVDAAAVGAFQARGLNPEGVDVLLYLDITRRQARIIAGTAARRAIEPDRFRAATDLLIAGAAAGDAERGLSDAADKLLRRR